jgi:Phage related hypothetical protein (DUF1799)
VLSDARGFGMDAASLADLRSSLTAPIARTDDEGVWPENAPIVQAFFEICTQWRTVSVGGGGFAGMGGASLMHTFPHFVGLDYGAVRAGLNAAGIEVTPDLWRGLRIMEAAALIALNEAD